MNERLRQLFTTIRELNHEINNPLTTLLGRAQLLQMQRDRDPSIARTAGQIEESARRIAALIQELGETIKSGQAEFEQER